MLRSLLSLCFAALWICGCSTSTNRVSNGYAFATAGIAYVDAFPAVLDESFELSVAANTATLATARPHLSPQDRITQLRAHNEQLSIRLDRLQSVLQHTLLLRSYFISLQALTAAGNRSRISNAAIATLERFSSVRGDAVELLDDTRKDAVTKTTQLLVTSRQNSLLMDELQVRGQLIEEELRTLEALVDFLVDDMISNAQAISLAQTTPLSQEFSSDDALKEDWNERRISLLRQRMELASLASIQSAAKNLHKTWIDLVENRTTEGALQLLLADVETFVVIAESFQNSD